MESPSKDVVYLQPRYSPMDLWGVSVDKKTLATSYIYTIFKQNNIYDLFFYPKSIAPSMFIKNMYNFFLQSHTMGSSKKHIFVEMCL